MAAPADSWDETWSDLDALRSGIARSRAVNINTQDLRDRARALVQNYFRQTRPSLTASGLSDQELSAFDEPMQHLLRLSHGRNAKSSYEGTLKILIKERSRVAVLKEQRLSERAGTTPTKQSSYSEVEERILRTLSDFSPAMANSYRQALQDLASKDRISFRGTALELRETLREVLDALAPDKDVEKSPGFAYEKDRTKPTMRQKTRFILRSRHLSEAARKTPEQTTSLIDDLVASLVRATYVSGSLATHVASEKQQVQQLKLYVDSVLSELLQVHEAGGS